MRNNPSHVWTRACAQNVICTICSIKNILKKNVRNSYGRYLAIPYNYLINIFFIRLSFCIVYFIYLARLLTIILACQNWYSQISENASNFILSSETFHFNASETPFIISCDKNHWFRRVYEPLYGFRAREKFSEQYPSHRSSSQTESPQVVKLFASDTRPSVHLPYVLAGARCGRVVARNGICVAPGRSRPTAVSGIARSHQCPPSPVARRRPPSAVSTHASSSRVARRDSTAAGTPRVVPRNPRAPYTAYTTPCEVDNPRGGFSRVRCTCSGKVTVDRHDFNPFGTETNLFIEIVKFNFLPPYKISDRSGFHNKNGMKNKGTFTENITWNAR